MAEREGLLAAFGGSPLSGPLGDFVACAFVGARYAPRIEPLGSSIASPLRHKKKTPMGSLFVAEREGFEPSKGLLNPYSLSRGAPSAARPPLRFGVLLKKRRRILTTPAQARKHNTDLMLK